MKLRNKKTGEIYDFKITPDYDDIMNGWKIENKDFGVRYYSNLAELNEEWEDDEEPKEYWCMDSCGDVLQEYFDGGCVDKQRKQIGNYFETKEEADKAVEKLKAWKRLSENKYLFGRFVDLIYSLNANSREFDEYMDDILLLFGGKE